MTIFEQYISKISFYQNKKCECKGEHHHPYPKSFRKIKKKHKFALELERLFGENLTVYVSYRVHFELHQLLASMFPEHSVEWIKMNNAMQWLMGNKNKYNISVEEFELVRQQAHKALSDLQNDPKTKESQRKIHTGKTHSQESKDKVSKFQKQYNSQQHVIEKKRKDRIRLWKNEEYRSKTIVAMKESHTPEICEKKSRAQKISQNRKEVREKASQTNAKYEVHEKRSNAISKSFEKRDKEKHLQRMHDANRKRFENPQERQKAAKNPKLFFALRRMAKRFAESIELRNVVITTKVAK